MSLIYRIKRLIKSDAHQIVDGLEDPKGILAQALRDMEAELERLESELKTAEGRVEVLDRKRQAWEEALANLESDIGLAMREKREDIAKALIRKALVLRKNLRGTADEKTVLAADAHALRAELADKRGVLGEIRVKADAFALKAGVAGRGCRAASVPLETPLEEEVELEFLRRLKMEGNV